jgi:hypothetical protein
MSKNILTAQVTVRGTRPLLWHWFGPDAIPLEKQERTGVAGNDPEEWKRTVLYNKDRVLYVNGNYAFGTLIAGAAYTKRGKSSLKNVLQSTLQILDQEILTNRVLPEDLQRDPSLPVYLDVRSTINPTTKGRNVRYRVAASPGWEMTFGMEWDKTIVSRNEMEAICIDAGRFSGFGSGRKIGMGRFEVVKFSVLDFDLSMPALDLTAVAAE